MKRRIEAPKQIEGGGFQGGDRFTHPAYGQIGASRVTCSGGVVLYGSDVDHRSYVRITIRRSELVRSLSMDSAYAGDEIVEVDLSEAQWATFVSTLNSGMGTQCTIAFTEKNGIAPEIDARHDRKAQFTAEINEKLATAQQEVKKLQADIEAMKISKKDKEVLMGRTWQIQNNVGSNIAFVAKQFDEHLDTGIQAAKMEVHAYIQNAIRAHGLESLKGSTGAPVNELESAEDKRD